MTSRVTNYQYYEPIKKTQEEPLQSRFLSKSIIVSPESEHLQPTTSLQNEFHSRGRNSADSDIIQLDRREYDNTIRLYQQKIKNIQTEYQRNKKELESKLVELYSHKNFLQNQLENFTQGNLPPSAAKLDSQHKQEIEKIKKEANEELSQLLQKSSNHAKQLTQLQNDTRLNQAITSQLQHENQKLKNENSQLQRKVNELLQETRKPLRKTETIKANERALKSYHGSHNQESHDKNHFEPGNHHPQPKKSGSKVSIAQIPQIHQQKTKNELIRPKGNHGCKEIKPDKKGVEQLEVLVQVQNEEKMKIGLERLNEKYTYKYGRKI